MSEEKVLQQEEVVTETPKKRKRKKAAATAEATEIVQMEVAVETAPEDVNETDGQATESIETVEQPETSDVIEVQVQEEPKQKKRKRKAAKVEINEAVRDARAQLKAAVQSMKIFTGMVEMIEMPETYKDPDHDIKVITHFEGFRIVIPACHMGLMLPSNLSAVEKYKHYKLYLSAMIGATFDYVVVGVDNQEPVAIGSRQIAMGITRKRNLVATYKRTGKTYFQYCMENAIPVPARVMAVAGSVVRLDVGGCEAVVRAKDAAWRYTSNLSKLFTPGDEIKVIIKNITHDAERGWKLDVSIREATPNRMLENIKKYRPNSVCYGVVSGATDKGYFIAIGDNDTGIDAFCGLVHGEVPQVGDVVSCTITTVDTEKGYALAKINRIIKKASRTY